MSGYDLAHAYETVNIHRREGAAKIELNRPETLNAWNRQFSYDLLAAVRAVAADQTVRAVMVTGAGRGFSSGADLREIGGHEDRTPEGEPDLHTTLTERYHPIMTGIRRMPKPVLAAVNGPAVGIGCALALCCDLIVAAESAYFSLAFVNIGLVPDGGSSLFVPARAGIARAFEMAMLGDRVPAVQAEAWGLANRVHPDASFAAEADELLGRLAAGPTRAYAGAKRELNHRIYAGMDEQLELEADIQQEMGTSKDFAEGVNAFAEKRPAEFSGA
ncbi:MAG: enoyl-CoA hydratase-related protein [Actinomycetota bacterium]|nr:enoyl-CoA hydratase-related protein [Actinomycetota bacterium]